MNATTLPQERQPPVAHSPSFACAVIPPRSASPSDLPGLETAMQSLALDARHPVALEIAGTVTTRQFILRATSQEALQHLGSQIQARSPQAEMIPLVDDPLCLNEGEAVSLVELQPGAASYLSLKTGDERERKQREGADPLLGVVATFHGLPEGMRVIAQLAVMPAPATWSQQYWRKAVEHPLEPERIQERRHQSKASGKAPSGVTLFALALGVGLLVLWHVFPRQLALVVPPWLSHALSSVLRGQVPHLTIQEDMQIVGTLAMLLVLMVLVKRVLDLFGHRPLYDMHEVQQKIQRGAYRTRLRLFVIGPVDSTTTLQKGMRHWWSWWKAHRSASAIRQAQLLRLIAAYRQFHQASGGYFVPKHLAAWRARQMLFALREPTSRPRWSRGIHRSQHLLSVAELLALWHLPQPLDIAAMPFVLHGRARTLLAPAELTNNGGWQLGVSAHAGLDVPVCLPPQGLRGNVLAVAATGKGKSTLFQHLAQAHLQRRQQRSKDTAASTQHEGLFVIEPHGDMIASLCRLLPTSLHDETVLIDLADQEYLLALNPLDMTLGRNRDKAVDILLSIFKHLWDNSWGPRTENILEYALKTLADANEYLVAHDPHHGPEQQYTLLDVIPLLRNAGFRHSVFEQVQDAMLLLWWQQYYEPMDHRFQTEVISSVVNKMSKYASSYTARRLLGQPHSSVDMQALIAQGKIPLVSTASGVIGSDLSALLGATLLGLFQSSLAEQARITPEERQHYLVLIDEFQTYPGTNYNTMLAELRKYGGTFGLATQSLSYLDVLDKALRPTVLSNSDHLYAFEMNGEDARMLLPKLEGLTIEDVTNLDDFMCYAKCSLLGRRLPVFSMKLNAIAQGEMQAAHQLRLLSRQRYARPVAAVDANLFQTSLKRTLAEDAALLKQGSETGHTESEGEQAPPKATLPDKKAKSSSRKRGGTKKEPPLTTPDGNTPLSQPIIVSKEISSQTDEASTLQEDGQTSGEEEDHAE